MKEKRQLAILDFDGTLVTRDILDLLCGIVGKGEESEKINEAFHKGKIPGLKSLVIRINFLRGVTRSQIREALAPNSYLMPGTEELMKYFKENLVITILASGNIIPVLEFYQQLLGIDYIVGSQPQMNEESIVGIEESGFSSKSFKVDGVKKILLSLDYEEQNIIAIGDSPSEKGIFAMSGFSIAVNPKGNIAEFADVVIEDDLSKAIPLIKNL